MGRTTYNARTRRAKDGTWWAVIEDEPPIPPMGPYSTKSEATSDLRGVIRFLRTYKQQFEKGHAMKLPRKDAVALFAALKITKASGWDSIELAKRLTRLKEIADDSTRLDDPRLDKMLRAALKSRTFEVTTTPKEEEGAAMTKKAAVKPAAAKKKASPAAAKKTPAKKKPAGPSNKEVVYKAHKKSAKKTPEQLFELVDGAVQLGTIRGWISMWKKGKGLPSCAKK